MHDHLFTFHGDLLVREGLGNRLNTIRANPDTVRKLLYEEVIYYDPIIRSFVLRKGHDWKEVTG